MSNKKAAGQLQSIRNKFFGMMHPGSADETELRSLLNQVDHIGHTLAGTKGGNQEMTVKLLGECSSLRNKIAAYL